MHPSTKRVRFGAAWLATSLSFLAVDAGAARLPFKETRLIIEYNASAEDIGVQFFLDADGWKFIDIFAPNGDKIFSATAQGRFLAQGGGTELFVESVEPPLAELPLEVFFARFPEGRYRFAGETPDGDRLTGSARFTHVIPEGPEVILPGPGEDCAQGVGIPAVISWEPVEESLDGEPVAIAGYEVIVENGEVFDIHLPGDATQVTVPAEFLQPATDYLFEVLAIEEGGNQTITEGCFRTAG